MDICGIYLKKNHLDAKAPSKKHDTDSGWDLCCVEDVTLNGSGGAVVVRTGLVVMYIDPGFDLEIRCRSGIAAKQSVCVVNGVGTIDNGYRGELMVIMKALHSNVSFKKGDRIAQLVPRVIPPSFVTFDDVGVNDTTRGADGLGSTKL